MGAPSIGEVSQKLKKKDEMKVELAEKAGVEPKAVNDKNLKAVSSALRGAKEVAKSGGDPTAAPIEALKQADPTGEAPKKESDEDKSNQQKIMMAFAAALPTILGYAVGGNQGGAIGAEAGKTAVGSIVKGIEDEEDRATKKAEKDAELAGKKEDRDFEKKKHNDTIGLKQKEIDALREKTAAEAGKAGRATAEGLRKERLLNPLTKQSQDVSTAYAKVLSAAENPSPAGDMSLLYGYIKLLDPGSVVKEGEYITAEQARNVPEGILARYNKAIEGERLTEGQRQDFLGQAGLLYGAQMKRQEEFDKGYRDLAARQGVAVEDVVMPAGLGSQDEVRTPPPGEGLTLPDGTPTTLEKLLQAKERKASMKAGPRS